MRSLSISGLLFSFFKLQNWISRLLCPGGNLFYTHKKKTHHSLFSELFLPSLMPQRSTGNLMTIGMQNILIKAITYTFYTLILKRKFSLKISPYFKIFSNPLLKAILSWFLAFRCQIWTNSKFILFQYCFTWLNTNNNLLLFIVYSIVYY